MPSIKDVVANYLTNPRTKTDVGEEFARASPSELVAALKAQAQGADLYVLGYSLFPLLKPRLKRDPVLVKELIQAASDRELSTAFRSIVLDFVDGVARDSADANAYFEMLMRLAVSDPHAEIRSQAVRLLSRGKEQLKVERVLAQSLADADPRVQDAAGHVIATWQRNSTPVSAVIAGALLTAVKSHGKHALQFPGLMSGLASLNGQGRELLDSLASKVQDADERARLIASAGASLSPAVLDAQMRIVAEEPNRASHWAAKGLVQNTPSVLSSLLQSGHDTGFAVAASMAASLDGKMRAKLDTLIANPNPDVAATAHRALVAVAEAQTGELEMPHIGRVTPAQLASSVAKSVQKAEQPWRLTEPQQLAPHSLLMQPGELKTGPILPRFEPPKTVPPVKRPPIPKPQAGPAGPVQIAAPFFTGFHMADALYRDLIMPHFEDHWHAGLFLGLTASERGQVEMRGIHCTRPPPLDGVQWFTADATLTNPNEDLRTAMAGLRDRLILQFKHADKTFHGAHVPSSGLSARARETIAATGASLYGRNIWWTFSEMLDYKWFSWHGRVDEIDESRCDGVVEYAYEASGVKVCSGKQKDMWNIAQAGKKYVKNHNDIHSFDYTAGELCPRIQAHDEGDKYHHGANDSTMVIESAPPPTLSEFSCTPFVSMFVPAIWFKIQTANYRNVSVRLTVSKDGGPFYFVRTEDPYGNSGSIVGDWLFKQVRANTSDRLYAWWLGKTVNGPDHWKKNGNFTFRILALDGGGNISAQYSHTLPIQWPS